MYKKIFLSLGLITANCALYAPNDTALPKPNLAAMSTHNQPSFPDRLTAAGRTDCENLIRRLSTIKTAVRSSTQPLNELQRNELVAIIARAKRGRAMVSPNSVSLARRFTTIINQANDILNKFSYQS